MPGRVHSLRQFDRLAKPEARGRSGPLRVQYSPAVDPSERFAVAFAIGKNVAGAVGRNRLRRRLRAVMDELQPNLANGIYLIKCDFSAKDLTYEQLRTTLRTALEGARVYA